MRLILSLLAAATVVATAASAAPARTDPRAEARLDKALDGRVAGRPVNCISLRDIRSTEIIDGAAIIYRLNNGRLYVNRPASGGASLRRDDVLVTRTWSPQLCSIDTVNLVDSASRIWRGSVGLGAFVPYAKADSQG